MARVAGIQKHIAISLIVILTLFGRAEARSWTKNANAIAQDYATIMDVRQSGETVLVYWVAAPTITSTATDIIELLNKYVLIGVSHSIPKNGKATYETIDNIDVVDKNGTPLVRVTEDSLPTTMVGFITAIQTSTRRIFGDMGSGIQWFVYDADEVKACGPGGIAVNAAGETYSYDTPMPGCP